MISPAVLILMSVLLLGGRSLGIQAPGQDDKILERGEKLLEEAKAAYEEARAKSSVAAFVDAGFKLEEARIKFIVLQEIGSPDKQKIATDRLRSVNQLSKLIHDGKVAISGSPAEVADLPSPKKIEPVPGADSPEKPPSPPPAPKPSVDVTRRKPIPDPAKQREAEKLVKDLFKDQYAKKSQADRKALARLLLEQTEKGQDDPAAQWVLCREAQDAATQACDVKGVIDAIEATTRTFDVDAMAMKTTAFAAMGKIARTPEENGSLAMAHLRLVDDLVAADLYDAADKATTAALQYARKSADTALAARGATRAKEISEAKLLYQAMKTVLETLAKSSDDPGANYEMGKFLCYVKGNWDLGLRFMMKGSDVTLRSLAEKELSPTLSSPERINVADGWWDLAEREKSPLRKAQLQVHAKALYEAAAPDATGLVAAKIEKRLQELGSQTSFGLLDLLALVDPQMDGIKGNWSMSKDGLTCAPAAFSRLQLPYQPPAEYDLTLVVERTGDDVALVVGLVLSGEARCQVIVDWDGFTGVDKIDGKNAKSNETSRSGTMLKQGRSTTLLFSVRREGISLSSDGKTIFSWKGSLSKLSYNEEYAVPDRKAIMVSWFSGGFRIKRIQLLPIGGSGRKLR
jgi:hypothetical protein